MVQFQDLTILYVMANSSSTGIDIVTKGEGTYEGEIDLKDSTTTMTLDCSISKDQKIEIHKKQIWLSQIIFVEMIPMKY